MEYNRHKTQLEKAAQKEKSKGTKESAGGG